MVGTGVRGRRGAGQLQACVLSGQRSVVAVGRESRLPDVFGHSGGVVNQVAWLHVFIPDALCKMGLTPPPHSGTARTKPIGVGEVHRFQSDQGQITT